MAQRRLNSFTLLSIENDLLRNIDISSLINDFAFQKSCKYNVYTRGICRMKSNGESTTLRESTSLKIVHNLLNDHIYNCKPVHKP